MGKPLKSTRVLDAFLECNNITSYSNELSGDGLSIYGLILPNLESGK